MERWLPVPGFEGFYEASSLGRVRSLDRTSWQPHEAGGELYAVCRRGRVLKADILQAAPYRRVVLAKGGEVFHRLVHWLVAEAFIGPRLPGYEVCHNDGDSLNNKAENIRYDTRAGNEADKLLHGTILRGSRHPRAKLTEQQVVEIRALAGKKSHPAIAKQYGVCRVNITDIIKGRTWRHVSAAGA